MDQRSIFITGAASGIGQEAARRFASAGWRVGLCDRNAQGLNRLAEELDGRASVHVADVCDEGALASVIAAFCATGQVLDVLFNCAGILEMRPFAQSEPDRLHAIIDVNVKGVINGIWSALPFLRARPGTRIITMSSLAAVYGVPEEAAYSASKFAVRGLTEALNLEMAEQGIWVTDIMVGYVATPMILEASERARSIDIVGVRTRPADVAETVWQAATGPEKVHWFVNQGDEDSARAFDQASAERRREMMKSVSGF